ncbi:hypothetical protein Csa_006926 [Cucumis sativus]|nr:hypothetical protein Csa_006926 [Cucumis sativus]
MKKKSKAGRKIRGPIPKSISKLSILHILDLSNNDLVGTIPTEMGQLMGMVNSLKTPVTSSDIIPVVFSTFLGNLTHLIVNWKKSFISLPAGPNLDIYVLLDLSGNHLSGQIPTSIGDLKSIKLLNLADNNLSGNIPSTFGNLEHVETLDLSHNKLSGSIPKSLAKLHQLAVLDVSNNQLTGRIPVGGQMSTMNILSYYANNSGLCGIQIQQPCAEDQQPGKGIKEEEKQQEFSWIGAGIGFPVGFAFTVLNVYMSGYLSPLTPHRHIIRRT